MKKNKIFAMILGTIVFVMVMFGCTTDQNTDQTSEPVTTNPSGNGGNNGSTKITSLQQVISSDEVQNGSKTVIDLSEYSDIENYDAIINKAVTIKNGDDLKDAVLNIVSDGVILDGIKQARVTTQSSMKISGSSLSSLSIASVSSSNASVITSRGGTSTMLSAGISASRSLSDVEMNGRGSAFPPIVEVYNTEVEEDVSVGIVNAYLMVKEFTAKKNVILNAVNAQLSITDKKTNIKEIKSDKSCLVILESGISDTIPIPTVTGNGIIKQIDMKASGEVKLLALAPISELTTVIKQGEAIDFSTMSVLGTYQADDGVTGFRAGDLTYDMTERFSKLEKDFTISIDGKIAYQAGQNVSSFDWSSLSVGTYTATLDKSYQYKENYTAFTFDIVIIGADESQTDIEIPTFELTEIEVKSDAAKTEYTVGEPLNLSGLLVMGTYKQKGGDVTYQNVISDYTLDPPNGTSLTTDISSVKVIIGDDEKFVTITVNPIQEEPETNPVIYTFKVNGGKWNDDTTEDKTFSGKSGAALTAPTPIRIGYTFNNWNENVPTVLGDEDKTFTAQWTALTYTVTLWNDGDVSGDKTVDVTYDLMTPNLTELPSKIGYTFGGYYAGQNGEGTQYIDALGNGIVKWDLSENVTLYALFTEHNPHNITYLNTKGVTNIEPATFKESQNVTLPTSITAVGYTFLGWYDSSADTASQVTGWNAGERTSNVTLWAKWIQSTLYVTAKTILDGETDTGDGTEENPFASISNAIAKINGYASNTTDYTIVLSGEFTGYFGLGVTFNLDLNSSSYRKWETDEFVAKSLTLTGKTGSNTDILNYPEENLGSDVLEIQTSVPVTITKLKITGGQTGICVNSDYADLTLGEGCLVTDNGNSSGVCVSAGKLTLDGGSITNNCCEYGGGVSVSGGEFVMLSGTIGGTEEEDANTADYRGAGVYVTGGTFTMKGGTICGNKSSSSASGAGVYVGYDDENGTVGTFVMEGGTISGNEADSAGGGVFVDGSSSELTEKVTFTMKGGTISGNKESSTDASWGACGGGGVSLYGEHAQFIMEDGTISKNEAACYGGGVSVVGSATFTMLGGTIGGTSAEDGNKVTLSSYSTYGGGVYVGSEAIFTLETGTISYNSTSSTSDTNGGGAVCAFNGTFIMKGGTLTNNTSCGSGGAVYIGKSGTFDMTGGMLIANSAENNGNAVFQRYSYGEAGTVKMGADALVVSNNDMYITDVIIITESLTGENPVATITSDGYDPERTILALADGANTTLAAECTKFAVTPQNGTAWQINSSGQLSEQ